MQQVCQEEHSKRSVWLLMGLHLTATGRHLPCGITQCYQPPDTSERELSDPNLVDNLFYTLHSTSAFASVIDYAAAVQPAGETELQWRSQGLEPGGRVGTERLGDRSPSTVQLGPGAEPG